MNATRTSKTIGKTNLRELLLAALIAVAVATVFSLAVGLPAAYAADSDEPTDRTTVPINAQTAPANGQNAPAANGQVAPAASGLATPAAGGQTTPTASDSGGVIVGKDAEVDTDGTPPVGDSAGGVESAFEPRPGGAPGSGPEKGQSEPLGASQSGNDASEVITAQTVAIETGDSPVVSVNGVNYESFDEAFSAVPEGGVLNLLANVERTAILLIDRSMTINGNGHTLSSTANRVIRVTAPDVELTLNKLNVESKCTAGSDVRGISLDSAASRCKLTLNNCTVSASFYAINVVPGARNIQVDINNGSVAAGWAAINSYSSDSVFSIVNSELVGYNATTSDAWNDFQTICFDGNALYDADNIGEYGSGNIVRIANSKVEASTEGTNNQNWLGIQYGASNNLVVVDAASSLVDAEGDDMTDAFLLGWYAGYNSDDESWTYYSGNNKVIVWTAEDAFMVATGYTLDAEANEQTFDIVLPDVQLSRSGYVFGGWTTGEDGFEPVGMGGTFTMPAEYAAVEFSALWLRDITVDEVVISDIGAVEYDGTAQEPDLVIYDGETLLVDGVDYEVSYASNVNAGEATATVTGIGGYAGTRDVTFAITEPPAAQESNGVVAEGEIFESASHDGNVVVLDVEDVTDEVVDLTDKAEELAAEYADELASGQLLEYKVFTVNLLLRNTGTGAEDELTEDFGTLTLHFRLADDDSLDGNIVHVTQIHIDSGGAAVAIEHPDAVISNGMVTVTVDCMSEFLMGVVNPEPPAPVNPDTPDDPNGQGGSGANGWSSGQGGSGTTDDPSGQGGSDASGTSDNPSGTDDPDNNSVPSPAAGDDPSRGAKTLEAEAADVSVETAGMSPAPASSQLPQTGDSSNALFPLALAAMAALACFVSRRRLYSR